MAPAYRVDHAEFSKPRAVECASPKAARAFVARELLIERIDTRQAFDLSQQGVDLQTPTKRGPKP